MPKNEIKNPSDIFRSILDEALKVSEDWKYAFSLYLRNFGNYRLICIPKNEENYKGDDRIAKIFVSKERELFAQLYKYPPLIIKFGHYSNFSDNSPIDPNLCIETRKHIIGTIKNRNHKNMTFDSNEKWWKIYTNDSSLNKILRDVFSGSPEIKHGAEKRIVFNEEGIKFTIYRKINTQQEEYVFGNPYYADGRKDYITLANGGDPIPLYKFTGIIFLPGRFE
jgi:hypothetical protein